MIIQYNTITSHWDIAASSGYLANDQFTDVPFTGKVTGIEQGKMKKGKKMN